MREIFGWLSPRHRFIPCQCSYGHLAALKDDEECKDIWEIESAINDVKETEQSCRELEDEYGFGEWHSVDFAEMNAETSIYKSLYKNGFIRVGEYKDTLTFEGLKEIIHSRFNELKQFAENHNKGYEFRSC